MCANIWNFILYMVHVCHLLKFKYKQNTLYSKTPKGCQINSMFKKVAIIGRRKFTVKVTEMDHSFVWLIIPQGKLIIN